MNIIFWLSTQQKEFGSGNSECLPENLENVIGFSVSLNKKKLTVTDKKTKEELAMQISKNADRNLLSARFVSTSVEI